MRGVLLSVLLLFLIGCVSTGDLVDAVNPMKEDKGITASVQLGKENNNTTNKKLVDLQTDVTTNQRYEAEEIGTIDNSTNIPWWALVVSLFVGILVRPIQFVKDFKEINDEPRT